MSEYLTAEELTEFTGSDKPAVQARYLQQNGIRYFKGANNKISTTWTAINHVLTGGYNRPVDDSDIDWSKAS